MTDLELKQFFAEASNKKSSGLELSEGEKQFFTDSRFDDYYKDQAKLSYESTYGSAPGSEDDSRLTLEQIAQRKQDRLSKKAIDLSNDDSNFMLKAKSAYNTVNDIWGGTDVTANYMGKQHTMSNKIFENVNDTMEQSQIKKQELIDQYNTAEDDPNARHKVYQLRLLDGYDENGNPIYTYKTGIAETSAAERYKNQYIKNGYEILSEKGFAGAEDWENQWHGLKANIADRTFEEGYNSKGKAIKDISGIGAGYSEVYNTQSFDIGKSQEEIDANKLRSEELAQQASLRAREGYGRGSDSMVDAFQAGGLKTLADFGDTVLDVVTPGDNTWLNKAKDQSNIDKYVGYDRKTGDKAIGEATGYFKQGKYANALWEVLKEPQLVAESIPMMIEMTLPLPTKITKAGKLYSAISKAEKAGDVAEKTKLLAKVANEVTDVQKGLYTLANNAGFLAAVSQQTNNQVEERVKNNKEAGVTGGDSPMEVAGVFASNILNLGLDRLAFAKITGFGGAKSTLGDAFGMLDDAGKKSLIKNIGKAAYGTTAAGATEGAQEYLQTWGEIINQELGTGVDGKTLSKIFSDPSNQDEAIGAMLAGAAGGSHMRSASNAAEYVYNKVTGKDEKIDAIARRKADIEKFDSIIVGGIRPVDSVDTTGMTPEAATSARSKVSKDTIDAIKRNGAEYLVGEAMRGEALDATQTATTTTQTATTAPDFISGSNGITQDAAQATQATQAAQNAESSEPEVKSKFQNSLEKMIVSIAKEVDDDTVGNGGSGRQFAKMKFESAVSNLISDTMDGLNTFNIKEQQAKDMFGQNLERLPAGQNLDQYLLEQSNKKKMELAKAIHDLAANNVLDERFTDGIISKFKKRYIDDVIKKAKDEEFNKSLDKATASINENTFGFGKIEIPEAGDAAGLDVNGMKKEPSAVSVSDETKRILKQSAEILYTMSGGKDESLAELIKDLDNSVKDETGKYKVGIQKTTLNVASDILNRGQVTKSGKKLESISGHKEKIKDLVHESEREFKDDIQNQAKKRNIDRVAGSLISRIDSLVNFANSRTNGAEAYGDKGLYSYASNETFTKEPITRVNEDKRLAIQMKLRDSDSEENTGSSKMNVNPMFKRQFIAGSARRSIMSAFMIETQEMNDALIEAGESIKLILAEGEGTLTKLKKEALNSKLEIIREAYKNNRKNAKKLLDVWIATHPGESIITDPKELAKELAKETAKKREKALKANASKVSTENSNEYDSTDTYDGDTETEFDFGDNEPINNTEESNQEESTPGSENIDPNIESLNELNNAKIGISPKNDETSIEILKGLKQLISNMKEGKLPTVLYGDKNLPNGVAGSFSAKDRTIRLKDNDGENIVAEAHEIVHSMTFEVLEKKMTKADKELVGVIKNNIGEIDTSKLSKESKKSIDQLINSIDGENNLFEKELIAIITSDAEARRAIVDVVVAKDTKMAKTARNKGGVFEFIAKVVKSFKEVIKFLQGMYTLDGEDYANRDTVAYRNMVGMLGRALRSTQNRDPKVKTEKPKASKNPDESKTEDTVQEDTTESEASPGSNDTETTESNSNEDQTTTDKTTEETQEDTAEDTTDETTTSSEPEVNTPTSFDENLKALASVFELNEYSNIPDREKFVDSYKINREIRKIITSEKKELDIKGLDAIIESLKELEKC